MELPSWLKLGNIFGKLNMNISGWFKREIKKQINTNVHIENMNVSNFQVMEKIGAVPDELTGGGSVPIIDNTPFPFERPAKFSQFPDQVIERVSLYLLPVICKATPKREVDVKGILNNTKTLFVNGRNYYDKEYWVQHCASSFREILVFVEPLHFNNAHQNIPDQEEIKKVFVFLINSVTYLSSVVHHRPNRLMGDAEKSYPKEGYGQMNRDVFLKQQDVFLERLCIDVVCTLNFLFVRYCEGNKKKI